MRVAAIYDIHGNLPALEAVLEELRREGVDRVVVGGDVVPGPMVGECIDLLLGLSCPVRFLRGNGENDVLAFHAGEEPPRVPAAFHDAMRWVAGRLSAARLAAIASWPATVRERVPGLGEVLFCHATPRDDNEIFTRLTPADRLLPVFAPTGAAVVVCGHTHMQFDRRVGSVRVVNAGSVGMPFGRPGAFWLRLGPDVELCRTGYDTGAAARRLRATGYPQELDLQRPPAAAEVLERFESVALGRASV